MQSGNSGGAVLDESGLVVGVVVGKLDALRVARVAGDVPQNVNFAIKGSVALNFLEAHGIRVIQRPATNTSRRVRDIAAEAQSFTVLLGCFR